MGTKFENVIKEINKTWGERTIIVPELGMSLVNEMPEILSTGFPFIDEAIGIGGIPYGRITEIMGRESSGKTTLTLHLIAQAQKKGERCAFIDVEHALDAEWAKKLGVDFQKLAISQPSNAEQALDLLEVLIKSKEFRLIVLDSVASLVPQAELEGEMGQATIGLQARLMGKILRKITGRLNTNKVCVIFVNQLRAKLGTFSFVPQETTPGGNALKFYATIRLSTKTVQPAKSKKGGSYSIHRLTVKKNKLASPIGICDFGIGADGICMDDGSKVINSE